jgi:hypothetical protein
MDDARLERRKKVHCTAPTLASHLERVFTLLLPQQPKVLYTLIVDELMTPETFGDDTLLVHALYGTNSREIGAVLRIVGAGTWGASCKKRSAPLSIGPERTRDSHPPQHSMSSSMTHSHRLPVPDTGQICSPLGQRNCLGGMPKTASLLVLIFFFAETLGSATQRSSNVFVSLHPSTEISK